jgi:hypothetical protein
MNYEKKKKRGIIYKEISLEKANGCSCSKYLKFFLGWVVVLNGPVIILNFK